MIILVWLSILTVSIFGGYVCISRSVMQRPSLNTSNVSSLWLIYTSFTLACIFLLVMLAFLCLKFLKHMSFDTANHVMFPFKKSTNGVLFIVMIISVLVTIPILIKRIPEKLSSQVFESSDDDIDETEAEDEEEIKSPSNAVKFTPLDKASVLMYFKSVSLLIWFLWMIILITIFTELHKILAN